MKVTLIEYTPHAAEVLIFTKNTRLNMSAANYEEIKGWPWDRKLNELEYMANSIPSSWEFVDYVFAIEGVSRGFTHQFVRTRTNSYAQQSMRVNDMSGFDYICGPTVSDLATEPGTVYHAMMASIDLHYRDMLKNGAAIEDARGILPTNIATNIVSKINLRTLSDMSRSRTGGRTQNEYRDVMDAMLNCVLDVHPWTNLFLFPKGRDYFKELEDCLQRNSQKMPSKTKQDILKIIDKMRKDQ